MNNSNFYDDSVARFMPAEIDVPFVYYKDTSNGVIMFEGFIPGFSMIGIKRPTIELCEKELKDYLSIKMTRITAGQERLPFFPTTDEIIRDYNPHSIKRIKIQAKRI